MGLPLTCTHRPLPWDRANFELYRRGEKIFQRGIEFFEILVANFILGRQFCIRLGGGRDLDEFVCRFLHRLELAAADHGEHRRAIAWALASVLTISSGIPRTFAKILRHRGLFAPPPQMFERGISMPRDLATSNESRMGKRHPLQNRLYEIGAARIHRHAGKCASGVRIVDGAAFAH